MKIDVVMPTYNSLKRIKLFDTVLLAIKKYIPLNNLIIVDRYSNDGTIEKVKEVFPNAIIIRTEANLAYARHIGIRHVETEWFAFIDDDAIILPHWFKVLSKFIKHRNVGAIEGGVIPPPAPKTLLVEPSAEQYPLILKYKITDIQVSDVIRRGLLFLARGFTINTLIRREAVKDWKPDPRLEAWDDYSLTQHVLAKGYLWIVVDIPLCIHVGGADINSRIKQWIFWIKKGLWHGSNTHYINMPADLLIIHSIYRMGSSLIKLIKENDLDSINYLLWHMALLAGMATYKWTHLKR
ncbi:glycosyltransferase family 2 protein [Vulcanisaeta thermophila]|uniref:glycosyltransferase family 2 protein n=1 Tax=Vulcanisaeta thermophila TaxID=867917 RepID=UPI0008539C41|nr:glycosyltransferase family 2 protein [Vulcanisaeta thermophila]